MGTVENNDKTEQRSSSMFDSEQPEIDADLVFNQV
jgi:hypothetical protein